MLSWFRNKTRKSILDEKKVINREVVASIEALEQKLNRRMAAIEKKLVAPKAPPLPTVSFSHIMSIAAQCPACLSAKIDHAAAYPSNHPRFRYAIILFCAECGTGFVPDADRLIDSYYSSEYATTNRRDRDLPPEQYFAPENADPRRARYFARATAQAAALANHGANFDRVLDYGSGPGYFLHISKAKKKFAVELDENSAKYLSYIDATRLSPDDLGRGAFDVILASHVVEHFTSTTLNPNLAAMSDALAVGGHMLIEVPHGGLSFCVLDCRHDPHTLFFTPEGIFRAAERLGLRILEAYPRGVQEAPINPNAVYTPIQTNAFFSTSRGGLTVIAQKME